jgi:hypothetical protein
MRGTDAAGWRALEDKGRHQRQTEGHGGQADAHTGAAAAARHGTQEASPLPFPAVVALTRGGCGEEGLQQQDGERRRHISSRNPDSHKKTNFPWLVGLVRGLFISGTPT